VDGAPSDGVFSPSNAAGMWKGRDIGLASDRGPLQGPGSGCCHTHTKYGTYRLLGAPQKQRRLDGNFCSFVALINRLPSLGPAVPRAGCCPALRELALARLELRMCTGCPLLELYAPIVAAGDEVETVTDAPGRSLPS
jgi:hypothetical protein